MTTPLSFVKKYFRQREVNILQVIASSVALVEKLGHNKGWTSEYKLSLAKELLPTLVSALCELDFISAMEKTNYQSELFNKKQFVEDTIQLIIDVSQQPNLFQANQWTRNQSSFCKL